MVLYHGRREWCILHRVERIASDGRGSKSCEGEVPVVMPRETIQKKIGRVRPPRVHITYDVETGGAIEKKEIPFVAGVLADLSGNPDKPLPKIQDRNFVEIDRDNFDKVLSKIGPRLTFKVDNRLTDED